MRLGVLLKITGVLGASAAIALACTDDAGDNEFEDSCGAPFYAGTATDEAFQTIVDAYASATDDPQKVVVTVPSEAQVIAASGSAPTFTWTSPLALGTPHASERGLAVVRKPPARAWLAEAWDAVASFVVGTAHAHLPPITGDIYFIEIKAPGAACPVARALTTDVSWTPSAADWAALVATNGTTLEFVVTSAYLAENRVQEGPFRAQTGVHFKVQ